MKKIISIVLVLLIAAGFCFAADPDASIYLKGTIEKGYLPEAPGNEGSDVFVDDGMTVLITVVENATDDSTANFGTGGNKPSSYASSVEAAKAVKFKESDTTDLTSLVLAYGAYGNVGSDNIPSISVTVAGDGWRLNGKGDPVSTLTLTLNTKDRSQTVFKGVESPDNTITISKNADGATSGIEKVGYTVINWGVVSGQTPTAGDYTATITITVEGDGASV